MDLSYTPAQRAFREEVRVFLKASLPHDLRDKVLAHRRLKKDDYVRWHRILHAKGWGAPTWPKVGLDHGTAALRAEAVGAMEKVIELTGEYLRTRRQFGVPLGSFQALQHRMADMLVQKELALSMAFVAAQALDEKDPAQRRRMLAAAKHTAAKAGRFVGQQAIQLHGGMGMTDEMAVGDYFKRLTMIDPLLGDADYQLDRFAAEAQES